MEKVILIRVYTYEIHLRSLNIEKLLRKADIDQMVYLQSGDIVFVPPTKIEEVARFFDHVRRIFRPLVDVERTIILGDEIHKIITGEDTERDIIIGFGDD